MFIGICATTAGHLQRLGAGGSVCGSGARLSLGPRVYLLKPSDLCSSSRMQQLNWSSTYLNSLALQRSSAPFTGYQWLHASASRH
ncbi:unnamed protein product [Pleuronectes platessa]|uniref:Uncharacterized protein n=1 Tax=Pleuronectes platessa TaxID=8262 RepID=A0A9N7YYD2_PLEPL|nr:unnamed protein product [Pleuronectes platessa]